MKSEFAAKKNDFAAKNIYVTKCYSIIVYVIWKLKMNPPHKMTMPYMTSLYRYLF